MSQCREWLEQDGHQCPATAVENGLCPLHNEIADRQPKHWYCFSYIGEAPDSHRDINASVYANAYTGYVEKGVTKAMIEDNKSVAGFKNGAVLISCSYLGEMTAKEFKDEDHG